MKSKYNTVKHDRYASKSSDRISHKRHKRRKVKDLSLLSVLFVFAGFCISFIGFLMALVICTDRVSEFLNGRGAHNNWHPTIGEPLDVLMRLPENLIFAFTHFLEALFASILFFPLIVLFVPLYDMFFFWDFSILLYGYLPFIVGFIVILSAIAVSDKKPE
ncbi:MAG: hypothetical protein ACK4VI_07415 [Alphaproteobacteria bacterium]